MNEKHNLNKWSAHSAYVLGLLWADGYLRKRDNGVVLSLIETDFLKIKAIVELTGKWHFRYIVPKNSPNRQIRAILYDKELKKFLLRYQYENKSLVSPNLLLSEIPSEYLFYWWRGYFDGDGSNNRNGIEFYGHYNQDWLFVNHLCKNLGNIPFVQKQRIRECGRSSFIKISNANARSKFLNFICQGERFGLERKHQQAVPRKRFSQYRGVYKSRYGKFRAQIKVNGKLFFLGNFTEEIEAAKAYDAKAKSELGNKAILNFF